MFDCRSETSNILQVRNSQATKELCTYLLRSPEFYKPQMAKVIKLYRVIMTYAVSSRDKVTANAIRTLGYFLSQIDIAHFQQELEQDTQAANFTSAIKRALMAGLRNKSPKVTWNSCIAIGKTIRNPTLRDCPAAQSAFFNEETTKTLFDIVRNRQNIKARNQAINTLLCYETLEQMGGAPMLPLAQDCIIDCLQYKTHFSGLTVELNYLDAFETNLLDLQLLISQFLLGAKDSQEVKTYLNGNATFLFLQQVTDYLRKEL